MRRPENSKGVSLQEKVKAIVDKPGITVMRAWRAKRAVTRTVLLLTVLEKLIYR